MKIKDLDARIELVMHLTDEQIDLVKELETSKEIWVALKEHHEPSNRTTKINALEKHGTWSLVSLPNGKNVISCKWVL